MRVGYLCLAYDTLADWSQPCFNGGGDPIRACPKRTRPTRKVTVSNFDSGAIAKSFCGLGHGMVFGP